MPIWKKFCHSDPRALDRVAGYTEFELEQIERLYGIRAHSSFRRFLNEMGRCDGGLIGDDPIILYREAWSVRDHLLFQMKFFSSLQECRKWDFLKMKPFVVALESETQYYFLQTNSDGEAVYLFDENDETVSETGLTFLEYLKDVCSNYGTNAGPICAGELIAI